MKQTVADYYDPDGKPITMNQWRLLFQKRRDAMGDESWWRKKTIISNEVEVSTVWIGLDYSFGSEQPLIWETMVFGGEYDGMQWRYSTREQALADHERIVKIIREGREEP